MDPLIPTNVILDPGPISYFQEKEKKMRRKENRKYKLKEL